MIKNHEVIFCSMHGDQATTFVCQHIPQSLASKTSCGFFIASGTPDKRPDAWCASCEKLRIEGGGEWQENCNDFLQAKILCAACYDQAKEMNEPKGGAQ